MVIVQVSLNRDFMRKNPLPALGFEPTTFQLASSCQGITFLGMVSLFLLVASALGDLKVATKTVTSVTGNIIQSLYIQKSGCAAASLKAARSTKSLTSLSHYPPSTDLYDVTPARPPMSKTVLFYKLSWSLSFTLVHFRLVQDKDVLNKLCVWDLSFIHLGDPVSTFTSPGILEFLW